MLIGCTRADAASVPHLDNSADYVLLYSFLHYRDALCLEQLLQELPIALFHLLNQVVDVSAVATVQSLELLVEEVEFISLLERSIEHVHSHVKVKSLVQLLIIIVLITG